MGLTGKSLISFFQEQVGLEKEAAKSINVSLKTVKNAVVIKVLKGVALDSLKHAELYLAAVDVASGFQEPLTDSELHRLRENIRRHIENENKMIERVDYAIERAESGKVRFLLQSIKSDEERHHELLERILDTIVRGETVTADEWWDFIWRDVPFHGTPGG